MQYPRYRKNSRNWYSCGWLSHGNKKRDRLHADFCVKKHLARWALWIDTMHSIPSPTPDLNPNSHIWTRNKQYSTTDCSEVCSCRACKRQRGYPITDRNDGIITYSMKLYKTYNFDSRILYPKFWVFISPFTNTSSLLTPELLLGKIASDRNKSATYMFLSAYVRQYKIWIDKTF